MPKKTKNASRKSQVSLPAIGDATNATIPPTTPVAKPAEPETPAVNAMEPALQPTGEFQQLRCTCERPPGFYGGRFVRNDYPTVIGRRLMRR